MCCANFGKVTFLDLWRSNGWECQRMTSAMDCWHYGDCSLQVLFRLEVSRIWTESGLIPGWGLYGVVLFNVLAHQGQTRSCWHKRLAGKVTTLYGLHDDVL